MIPRWPRGLRKPRIRTVLVATSFVILLAPLGGFWLLRLYESALIRQTETELIGQAAVIAAAYRVAWVAPGPPAPVREWTPRGATLDLARDPIRPVPSPARPAATPPDPRALIAGAALQPVLSEAQRVTLAAMRVLDRHGRVVASSGEETGLSLAHQEEAAAALAGHPVSTLRARVVGPEQPRVTTGISRSAPFRVFVAQPVIEAGTLIGAVVLSRTPPSIEQTLHHKRWEIGVMMAALLLAAGVLALFTAATVSRPIGEVAAEARAVAAGGRAPEARVRGSIVREADELSAAIRAMAETLHRRADYIGAFATEVSHEFKTPLAALRGALELLQDHAATMTTEERDRFLVNCVADVERLDRLVRRLLELARAEALAPGHDGPSDVAAVLADAVAPFRAEGLTVRLQLAEALPLVRIGGEALHAVLANLLENARQHAGKDVTVTITAGPVPGGKVELRFADDGAGISAGNAPRVFDRFFTTARDVGGTGLGLPLARSRLEAAGGSIALLRGEPGAAFRIVLPAAQPSSRTPSLA